MFRIWHLYTIVIISNVISNSYPYSNENSTGESDAVSGRTLSGTHRVIKRFTSHFSIPKPKLPTLPRPSFSLPLFSRGLPKGEGEDDDIVIPPGNRRKRPRPKKKKTEIREDVFPHEDRTLMATAVAGTLAAKKALLLKKAIIAKKAIIFAKLNKKSKAKKKKKWKKKAALAAVAAAYGLKKASKIKGLSVKTPSFHVSFGPSKKAQAVVEEAAKVAEEEDEDAISFLTAELTEEDTSNSTETENGNDNADSEDTDAIVVVPAAPYDNKPTEAPLSISMMQQLQQQLLKKQQEQQQQQLQATQPPPPPPPPEPQPPQIQIELFTGPQSQQQQPQQQQTQVQAQAIPEILSVPGTEDIDPEDLIEAYKAAKAKKAKKKAKKSKPRPVNLGVKANLYKKFDELAKQAHKGISTFITVDVDFLTGRSALDDLIKPPHGFFSRRTAKLESAESKENWGYNVGNVEIPANFMPSWSTPIWAREYPRMTRERCQGSTGGCILKPVYLLFKNQIRPQPQ